MGPRRWIGALLVLLAATAGDSAIDDGNANVVAAAEADSDGTLTAINVVQDEPEFTNVIDNVTVPAGRSVRLACSVKNLGSYKVAWMHFEQSAILTVHNHVITRNPRISVTHDKHDKHRTWYLHIKNVHEEDKGRYMCQINTVTAKTQFGYVHVVVPPNIDDSLSSSDVIVRENSNVTLRCRATGSPQPSVKWKRDDNARININKTLVVTDWDGDILEISRISRLDMGAYLCIASNGVPPSVSKRIKVSVDFPPMLWIPHQLVGAPEGLSVTLECFSEAHPTSLNYWTKSDGQMIHDSQKYREETSTGTPGYKTHMRLTIFHVNQADYGMYKCVAKNPRGETDGTIRVYAAPGSLTTLDTLTGLASAAVDAAGGADGTDDDDQRPDVVDKNSKYLSNLNEIDKSEQKSTIIDSAKGGFGWPTDRGDSNKATSLHPVSRTAVIVWNVALVITLYTTTTNNNHI